MVDPAAQHVVDRSSIAAISRFARAYSGSTTPDRGWGR
jgi:hypothetical protein